MRQGIVAILIALFLTIPVHAYNNGVIREQTIYTEDSTNVTVALLPATTGVTYTVFGFDMAISSADNIYLECGSTKMTGYFLAANSGVVRTYYPLYFQCPSGAALNLVKGTSTTPVRVLIFYDTDN